MPGPDFQTTNPAIEEFNRANAVAQQQQNADLEAQGKVLSNKTAAFNLQTAQTEAPSRLKMLSAQADRGSTDAQYAGPQAAAQLAATRASTAATISSMTNAQARLHMEAFTQAQDLLDKGDVDGAKRVAASVGDTIPDAVISNSQLRAGVKAVTAAAQQIYPNRPKDQLTYIHAHIGELATQAQQGQQVNPTTAPYTTVPGTPQPPEVSGAAGSPKWGIVGTDEYGNPVHGWIQNQTQTISVPGQPGAGPGAMPAPAPINQPMMPQPGGTEQRSDVPQASGMASAAPDGTGAGGATTSDVAPMGQNTTRTIAELHGDEYLRTLPTNEAALVKGIAENRINSNSLSVKGGHRERVLGEVEQYKPGFNQTLFSGAQSYQRTAGAAGARVEMASNEVAQALPLALESSRNLPRGQFVPWNTLVQKWEQGTSDPAYNDFVLKNFALINAYTRAMNPLGVPRITERLEQKANGILSTATSPEAYQVQANALWQEVERSRAAIAQTRGGTGPSANEATTDAPMPTAPGQGSLPRPLTLDEARGLPSGSHFIDPNGVERIVP